MKYKINNPLEAALRAGGCTLEPEIGWWTYSTDHFSGLEEKISNNRDALYIPTLQKNGLPVDSGQINCLQNMLKSMGFSHKTPATGMWVLSETNEVQIEYIWILWSNKVSDETRDNIASLAEKIKEETNQDSVAYELDGCLFFI